MLCCAALCLNDECLSEKQLAWRTSSGVLELHLSVPVGPTNDKSTACYK